MESCDARRRDVCTCEDSSQDSLWTVGRGASKPCGWSCHGVTPCTQLSAIALTRVTVSGPMALDRRGMAGGLQLSATDLCRLDGDGRSPFCFTREICREAVSGAAGLRRPQRMADSRLSWAASEPLEVNLPHVSGIPMDILFRGCLRESSQS